MKKALKELIENSPDKHLGVFTSFIFIPDGLYKGFWGENGYDNMIVLGFEKQLKMWCRITGENCQLDLMTIVRPKAFNIHFKHELGVPEVWFDQPIMINHELQTSMIMGGNYD